MRQITITHTSEFTNGNDQYRCDWIQFLDSESLSKHDLTVSTNTCPLRYHSKISKRGEHDHSIGQASYCV